MRLGEQPDDLAERRLGAELLGADLQPAELVDRAGEDGIALTLVDRHALAGEHGLVDGRSAANDRPVDADPLSGPDDDEVSDRQLLDRDLDLGLVANHPGGPRIDVQQRPDGAAGAVEAEGFETFAHAGR